MTDDLVKWLRDACRGGDTCKCSLNEAADRIDELERELVAAEALNAAAAEAWNPAYDVAIARAEAAEARLAKAIEALTTIAADASVPVRTVKNGINHKKMYKGWRKIATTRIDIARTTLAEIEEEDR